MNRTPGYVPLTPDGHDWRLAYLNQDGSGTVHVDQQTGYERPMTLHEAAQFEPFRTFINNRHTEALEAIEVTP